jgi:phospholipid transport system substrate-binding protein
MIENAVAMLADAVGSESEVPTHNRQALEDQVDAFLIRYADMRGACRIILSKHWRTATTDQRGLFMEAFNDHVRKLLINLILTIDFDTVIVEPFAGNIEELPATVRATFRTDEGSIINFDFRAHNKEGDWRILDVVAEGVSYLKIFRSEFGAQIADQGLEQAIAQFAQRSAD